MKLVNYSPCQVSEEEVVLVLSRTIICMKMGMSFAGGCDSENNGGHNLL